MAIGPDRVQVTKVESSALGGDDNDANVHAAPSPIEPQEDALECAGLYLQDASNRDENVYFYRDSGKMYFRDTENTTAKSLSDLQDVASHASTHGSGGSDAIKLDDLASPDDNTDLNATTSKHGLLPKLGGGTTNFLRADGSWAEPSGGGPYVHGSKTTSQMQSISSPSTGDTCYNTDWKQVAWYDGDIWMCTEVIKVTNKSGASLATADVVVISTSYDESCATTTIFGDNNVLGPVVIGGANNAYITVAVDGIWNVLFNTEAVSRGDGIITSNTAKQAVAGGGGSGVFAQALDTKSFGSTGNVKCLIGPRNA